MRASTAVSFPASKESQEMAKITTVTPGVALVFQKRRWSVSANAAVGFSMYQKSETATASEHSSMDGSMAKVAQKAGHASGESAGHDEGPHDREQARYMGGTQVNYRITSKFTAGSGVDVARTYWEMDDPTWLTSAMVARFGYQIDRVNSSIGFGFQKEDHAVSVPTDPLVRLLVQYSY